MDPFTPEWWLAELVRRLVTQRKASARFAAYYDGNHDLEFASEQFRRTFGSLFLSFADNWCPIVVEAPNERLQVVGFRYGEPAADEDAHRIWQANGLDAGSGLLHREALIHGGGAVTIWGDGPDERTPRVTVEHPDQVYVATASDDPRRRLAALKVWTDEWTGNDFATLYLPGGLFKFEGSMTTGVWTPRELRSEDWPLPNPLGVVPVVPFYNDRRMLTGGRSELRDAVPVQDAINKLTMDLIIASEFSSIRQRWATGMEVPTDPTTNEPIEPWEAAVRRLWIAEDPDTRFGEFGVTDLSNIVTAIRHFVNNLSSKTRTPPHYLTDNSSAGLSGESIKAAETGLVSKVRSKMTEFGESWEEVLRLAFAVIGDDRSGVFDSETIWADPESRTESEHIDAVGKKVALLGIPRRQAWEDADYTPAQIARMEAMLADDVLLQGLLAQDPTQPQSAALSDLDVEG